jgi:hypothetical protein
VVAVTLQAAHKAEHAVDLDTGAAVAVTLQAADKGDTTTLDGTLCEAGMAVAELVRREAELQPDDKPKVNVDGIEELVTDKGYHSGAVVQRMKSYDVRSYIPEKQQKGRRNWEGKAEQQQAVHQNNPSAASWDQSSPKSLEVLPCWSGTAPKSLSCRADRKLSQRAATNARFRGCRLSRPESLPRVDLRSGTRSLRSTPSARDLPG